MVAVNVHGSPEINLRDIGRSWITGIERIENFEPAQIYRMMKRKGPGSGFHVAAKSIECDEHHLRILRSEFLQRFPKGRFIFRMDLFRRLRLFRSGCRCPKIHEVKFEHANAAVIPELQDVHEIR